MEWDAMFCLATVHILNRPLDFSCFQGDHSSGEIQVIGGDNFEKLRGKVGG